MAEVTTLVRGRLVDIYLYLGQQVKTGDLLAMLYVAERLYERAKMFLAEKVLALADAQKRKG